MSHYSSENSQEHIFLVILFHSAELRGAKEIQEKLDPNDGFHFENLVFDQFAFAF